MTWNKFASGKLVSTFVDVEPLIQAAVACKNEHFEQEANEPEGLDVSLQPLSPFLWLGGMVGK